MVEPYRYRVHGVDAGNGLTSVWSFEQESKPGNIVWMTETGANRCVEVTTAFQVRAINNVPEISDWGIPNSEMFVEVIEPPKAKRFLRNAPLSAAFITFVGCGKKRNPIHILHAGSLSGVHHWTKKCGSERGVDSGQYFICHDCAVIYGYCW